MPRGLCNAISVACQLRKKAVAAEIGRLGVWVNHVKISVVASETWSGTFRERSTYSPTEAHCKSPARIRIGDWPRRGLRGGEWLGGGKVTVYIEPNAGHRMTSPVRKVVAPSA